MIARMWHGRTRIERSDEYLAFLQQRAIPDYEPVPGNLAVFIFRRAEGEIAHYITLTHWASLQAIDAFAGADISTAKYYPEDAGFLFEFEPEVQHDEVFS